MAPVWHLVSVLGFDDHFLAEVERVRSGASVDGIARSYVWREGRSRRVFRELLTRSAGSQWTNPAQPVLELAGVGVACGPREPGDPAEWTHAKRQDEAARMLARIGAKRCIWCSTRLASDRRRQRYCDAHQPRGPYADKVERSDREAITNLLNAVGDALAIE
jgi:hypothetical protein